MVEISTSLLNVEKENIIKTIYNLETAKTDYFHIDVMDGEFVENNTVDKMLEYCDYLTSVTNIPLDIHLMVKNVRKYIDLFLPYNPNIITIHFEAIDNIEELEELVKYIQSNGCKVGVSIKPSTEIFEIHSILDKIHLVLIMTVEPGKGGQDLIEKTISKIEDLSKYIEDNNLDVVIEADGGINLNNVESVKNAGCEIIVSGTAITKVENYKEVIEKMKM